MITPRQSFNIYSYRCSISKPMPWIMTIRWYKTVSALLPFARGIPRPPRDYTHKGPLMYNIHAVKLLPELWWLVLKVNHRNKTNTRIKIQMFCFVLRCVIWSCCLHKGGLCVQVSKHNTMRSKQNGYFPHDIFKCIFSNENVKISIKIPFNFFP